MSQQSVIYYNEHFSSSEQKVRIEWIDLAKGFCIIFVVVSHVLMSFGVHSSFNIDVMSSVRMPLYFILSGLFFKQYDGFLGFIIRKLNKLIIPFLFFFLLISVIPSWIMGYNSVFSHLYYNRNILYNGPIWFLLCLFEVNVLFYIIQMVSNHVSKKFMVLIVITLSFFLGFLGLTLNINEIKLPLFIDTAFTATPLFAFGWLLFRHTTFLKSPVNYKRELILLSLCLLVFVCFTCACDWWMNSFRKNDILKIYPACLAGPMIVLILSKMIGRIGIISHWGRYSIMVLVVHNPLILFFSSFFRNTEIDTRISMVIVFIITMFVCHLLIPLFKRYLPYFTAQKDLFRTDILCKR